MCVRRRHSQRGSFFFYCLQQLPSPSIASIMSWYAEASRCLASNKEFLGCRCGPLSHPSGRVTPSLLADWERSLLHELSERQVIPAHSSKDTKLRRISDLRPGHTRRSLDPLSPENTSGTTPGPDTVQMPSCRHYTSLEAFQESAAEAMQSEVNLVFNSGAQWRILCPVCGVRQIVGAPLLVRLW